MIWTLLRGRKRRRELFECGHLRELTGVEPVQQAHHFLDGHWPLAETVVERTPFGSTGGLWGLGHHYE